LPTPGVRRNREKEGQLLGFYFLLASLSVGITLNNQVGVFLGAHLSIFGCFCIFATDLLVFILLKKVCL
jgi:hypothetical protein